ncbi:hypothetical protein HDU78_009419 [Chytriomyces hyalinus]|nr:hypothetical protein HDU78_009419 [Chytriomyces hyalinus]
MVSEAILANSIFYPAYCLFLPTSIIATVVDALLLYVILRSRAKLLATKLDQIVAALIGVCLLRSSVASIRYIVILFLEPSFTSTKLVAIHGSLGVCLMLTLHLMLAVERHVVLCQVDSSRSRLYYMTSIAGCMALSFALLIAVAGSESVGMVTLDPIFHAGSNSSWLWLTISTYVMVIGAILFIYSKTYSKMTTQLRENLTSQREERLRLFLQQKVLKSCIIMSLTMVVCYLPGVISLLVSNWLRMDSTTLVWIRSISGELILMDLVATPIMICFFQTQLRAEVLKLFRWGKFVEI